MVTIGVGSKHTCANSRIIERSRADKFSEEGRRPKYLSSLLAFHANCATPAYYNEVGFSRFIYCFVFVVNEDFAIRAEVYTAICFVVGNNKNWFYSNKLLAYYNPLFVPSLDNRVGFLLDSIGLVRS